ncbi:dephospho-CoA kinase isoform X2 [Parasteatoda tepidariorum]|uniref:dephospho-CoA kinase isoform X2 n=1 Tax=Parasteatoda tepidariorum TaxID=114398 RepID=UPI001C72835D|nr:dephospho-CoA kinase domain-containing protein isoform X2 [Parasteatoda tepidariorum]
MYLKMAVSFDLLSLVFFSLGDTQRIQVQEAEMFLVGLTGGIATGKSSVVAILRSLGIEVIDADVIAREVVEPGKTATKKIRKEFGDAVFNSDGTLNRQKMGQIVFSQPDKRRLLNSFTHPEIYKSIMWKCLKLFFLGHQFTVIDLPLLYESGKMVKYLHKTVVVSCEPDQQLQRLMVRDSISEEDALARIKSQMSLTEKVSRADFVIRNEGEKASTTQQVEEVVKQLRLLRTHWKYRFVVLGCCLVTVTVLSAGPYLLYKQLN